MAAALIAGFVGAIFQFIILYIYKFPRDLRNIIYIFKFLVVSFIISGLLGFPIKASRLFPHLAETYYKDLGPINGIIHDGVSGLIVQITVLLIYFQVQ